MTFNINVPNGGQSPSLFPAQNQTNFIRLKTLVAGDHIFNDSAAANDGTHKQVTFTNRARPTTLPTGTNGMFYTANGASYPADVTGYPTSGNSAANELYYYDGSRWYQLTPTDLAFPVRVCGSVTLPANGNQVIFNVTYNWAGVGFAICQETDFSSRGYTIERFGNKGKLFEISDHSGTASRPYLFFDGTKLKIANGDSGSARTLSWSLTINRLS